MVWRRNMQCCIWQLPFRNFLNMFYRVVHDNDLTIDILDKTLSLFFLCVRKRNWYWGLLALHLRPFSTPSPPLPQPPKISSPPPPPLPHSSWLNWAVLGCTGLLWIVMGYTGLYWTVLGCSELNLALMDRTGLHWAVLDSTGLFWGMMDCTGL